MARTIAVVGYGPGISKAVAEKFGKEGFSGTPLIAGFRTSHTRTVVQAEATAYRIDADTLRGLLIRSPKLERQLSRFVQFMGVQVT